MSSAEIGRAVDASPLTPAPAPMTMPARELRTVGGLLISALSGVAALGAASLPQRTAVSAVETETPSR